jgi:hypothetical protein
MLAILDGTCVFHFVGEQLGYYYFGMEPDASQKAN